MKTRTSSGAVVDPKLDGRVKVTVIATGFDAVAAQRAEPVVVASASQTPVDLQHYTQHLKEKVEVPAPIDLGRLSIARRPALDLASAPAPAAAPQPPPPSEDGDIDLEALTAFDVPAFLRREG